jgi:phosphoribosylanthranilate isomerase
VVCVKICGITNREDALAAAELGADAVGFVFYPKSPRYVKPEEAGLIISQLPAFVTAVGVFANQGEEEVRRTMEGSGIELAQFQGDETPDFCRGFGPRVLKAIRVKDNESIRQMANYSVRAFVLDTYHKDLFGGTGRPFEWDLALQAKSYGRIVLAGGLTPENVKDAIAKVQPYGVDVSSGVEDQPGKKDHRKIEEFIRHVKN